VDFIAYDFGIVVSSPWLSDDSESKCESICRQKLHAYRQSEGIGCVCSCEYVLDKQR